MISSHFHGDITFHDPILIESVLWDHVSLYEIDTNFWSRENFIHRPDTFNMKNFKVVLYFSIFHPIFIAVITSSKSNQILILHYRLIFHLAINFFFSLFHNYDEKTIIFHDCFQHINVNGCVILPIKKSHQPKFGKFWTFDICLGKIFPL